MEAEKKCRPTLADVWEGLPPSSLPPVDAPMHDTPFGYQVRRDMFFSWEEARHMESSGVMAVAAHSARHLAVFAGPEWGPVNRHDRHQKPASALEAAGQRFHVPGTRANTFNAVDFPEVWGLPRFKERPFLYSRAFIPSPDLVAAVQRLVPQEPAEAVLSFSRRGMSPCWKRLWRDFPRIDWVRWRAKRPPQPCARRTGRLRGNVRRELGHPVRSLCWPWGSGSGVALEEGRKAGFSVFFTTRMGANPPAAPEAVHRFKVRDVGGAGSGSGWKSIQRPWLARLYGACRI